MTEPAPAPQGQTRFSAVLTPHRSLGPKGFMVLMGAVCAVSFGTGLLFYLLGATLLGLGFLRSTVAFTREISDDGARRVLRASLIYLPLLLALLLMQSVPESVALALTPNP